MFAILKLLSKHSKNLKFYPLTFLSAYQEKRQRMQNILCLFLLQLLFFREQLVVLLNRFANDLDGFIGTQRFIHGGLLVL